MAVRIRKSVWSLPQGDPAITWYRKAVETLLAKDINDPKALFDAIPAEQAQREFNSELAKLRSLCLKLLGERRRAA